MSSSMSTSSSLSSSTYESASSPSFSCSGLLSSGLSLDRSSDPPAGFRSSCAFRSCFLCFIRRFWNHVLTCDRQVSAPFSKGFHSRTMEMKCLWCVCVCVYTCVSDRLRAVASSTLSGVDRYRWISNLFSSPDSWESENTVRAFRRRQCLPGNSAWCWNKAGICTPAGGTGRSLDSFRTTSEALFEHSCLQTEGCETLFLNSTGGHLIK